MGGTAGIWRRATVGSAHFASVTQSGRSIANRRPSGKSLNVDQVFQTVAGTHCGWLAGPLPLPLLLAPFSSSFFLYFKK
jgi:hypothetical protein